MKTHAHMHTFKKKKNTFSELIQKEQDNNFSN